MRLCGLLETLIASLQPSLAALAAAEDRSLPHQLASGALCSRLLAFLKEGFADKMPWGTVAVWLGL